VPAPIDRKFPTKVRAHSQNCTDLTTRFEKSQTPRTGICASRPKILKRSGLILLTCVRPQATVDPVIIRNFIHKGLKKLYEDDSSKGVSPDTVDKLRKMLAFLDDMQDPEELRSLPSWKVHTLTGDRKGTWSLSVTRNRRLTFCIDSTEREIYDVNLEDYH